MALLGLTADLVAEAVVAPGTSTTWNDDTIYGAGGDPDRNEVALYLTAYKVDEDQEETALTVEEFDPEVVTEFITENTIDGWYRYYFIIVANWSVSQQYSRYDLVWSTAQNAFYEYRHITPTTGNDVTNTTYFTLVTDPTSRLQNLGTAATPGNIDYQIIDKIVTYQTSICYIKAAGLHAKENCSVGNCGCDSKLGRAYHKIRDLFNVLPLNEVTGQFIEGEKNARLAEKWCDDCGCLIR